ncbi:MAG: NAD-dependent epimerase/dehydratase family protein [Candidatus Bathyarchaeota archaeon]
MKHNILITGGLGFIGSHIVSALAGKKDCEVTVLDIRAPKSAENQDVSLVKGDIHDLNALKEIFHDREISTVIHMIGLVSIPSCNESPDTSFRLNVSSVHNILEVMRLCDVARLVFPSTAAVYGGINGPKVNEKMVPRPANVYGFHKLAAESLIDCYAQNYGLNPTILRIFNVYGDVNKEQGVISSFIRKAVAGEPLAIRGGNQLRDFVLLSDVVETFIKSLDSASSHRRTINVGSGVGVSIKEIAQMIKQSFPNARIKYEPKPKREYSIYADVALMRNLLGRVATSPTIGIPKFINKCKHEEQLIVG